MTKKREVSSSLRDQCIGLFKANYSFSQISKVLSRPKSTMQYIVNKWKGLAILRLRHVRVDREKFRREV